MNGLLCEMRRGMEELQLGLDGALNMSAPMEALLAAMAAGRVPPSWMACMSTRIQVRRVLGDERSQLPLYWKRRRCVHPEGRQQRLGRLHASACSVLSLSSLLW